MMKKSNNMNKPTKPTTLEERSEREKDMKLIQLYRDKSKKETISLKLRDHVSTAHTIYPSFGVPVFFEYCLHNPYEQEHCFTIDIQDREIQLGQHSFHSYLLVE